MGNAPATLVIITDDPHPVAGTTLTGTVYLDIAAHAGISANRLCLSFHGEEMSTIAAYMGRADATFSEESTCNIISLTVPLLDALEGSNALEMGQYELPFAVQLPSWLPSTMVCRGQEGSSCGIRYYLEAFALRDGKHKLNSPLIKKDVLILGKSKTLPRPQSLPPSNRDKMAVCEDYKLFSLFCYPRGTIRVQGEISPTSARLGDTLTLSLDICNESKSTLDEIEIKLKEDILWKVGVKSSMPRTEKVKRMVAENIITSRQFKRHRPTGQVSPATAANGDGPHDDTKEGVTKRHHIKISVAIPHDARCTYEEEGTLLSVSHILAISLKLNGCSFLTSQPELHVPIKIQPPSEHEDLIVQMNKKRPRMVRRSVYGHDMGEKVVGENPLFDNAYLRKVYRQGDGDAWSHLADEWHPVHVGKDIELDLQNSGKVGGEEDISLF